VVALMDALSFRIERMMVDSWMKRKASKAPGARIFNCSGRYFYWRDFATLKGVRTNIVVSVGLVVVLTAATAGVWFWHPWQQDETQVNSRGGSIALDTGTTASSRDVPVSQTVDNSAVNTTNNTGNSHKVSDNTNNSNNNSTSVPTSSNVALPKDFAQFDQYKDSQSILLQEITPGTGAEVVVGKQATVNYRGWLTNGTKFDESYNRGQAFSFTPGEHRVITGWEQGVIGMKVGGKRRLVIPPAFGYGAQATGPIPANSVLVFDIELLDVK
jgi:FKBP-type peptidyl-prolyl cis-trans isomerase FkpA